MVNLRELTQTEQEVWLLEKIKNLRSFKPLKSIAEHVGKARARIRPIVFRLVEKGAIFVKEVPWRGRINLHYKINRNFGKRKYIKKKKEYWEKEAWWKHNKEEVAQKMNKKRWAISIEEIANYFGKEKKEFIRRHDGRIVWVCEHGVEHTVWFPDGSNGSHVCDGCCKNLKRKKNE